MVQMDDLLFISLTLVSLTSAEASLQLMIHRGLLKPKFVSFDVFGYTANICGNYSYVNKWCKEKNAYQVTSIVAPQGIQFPSMCFCYCYYDYKTFLSRKEKCVNEHYLEKIADFGTGVYKFDLQVNFSLPNHNGFALNVARPSNCQGCQIANITYLEKNQWKSSLLRQSIFISRQCVMTWTKGFQELAGKIVKIQFAGCTKHNIQPIFLKSKGQYVIDIPTPPPEPPPSPTVIASSISSSMDSSDTPTFTSSTSIVTPTPVLKISTQQVSEYFTPPQVSPTKAFIASSYACSGSGRFCPSSSSAAVLLPTMHSTNKINPDHQSSSSSSLTWTITAVVVACIVVGGVVALLVILRRHNSCDRARSSRNLAKTSVADSTDNPLYGHNQGEVITLPNRLSQPQKVEDEEYDYAAVDGGHNDPQKTSTPPLYQSLVKENVRDSVYTPLNKEATETPVDYSYNHLQHPQYNPHHSKSDPLYNTLEPPNNDEYMEPETQISDNQLGGPEPVYNVLEGPDASPAAPQDNDPVYNVLEGPDTNPVPQDNDPVYNVLEDPNANQYPTSNVLEGPDDDYDNAPSEDDENLPASGQDNVAYSSTIDLRKTQSPSSPDYDVLEGPEVALQDSTYQPLGVRAQDDVYQPLDRTSQPIYQSLEPNDSMA